MPCPTWLRGGILVVLAACAPAYGPLSSNGGYEDVELRPGRYYVDYRGARGMDPGTVVAYWQRRAAELCSAGFAIEKGNGAGDGPEVSETAGVPSARGEIRCR